jgi:hypothetical protein
VRAAGPLLMLWCCVVLAPGVASAADRTGSARQMPCAGQFSVTKVAFDPNAVVIRFREPAGPFAGPITAYGSDRMWVGIVERTAMVERNDVRIVSLELHADGPIEGVSYAPAWAACTFRAGTSPPNGYDRDVQSPVLTLANPQPVAPATCAHPYVPTTVTHAFEPVTPQEAVTGTVSVAVALDERGIPQAARIVASPSPVLNNTSLGAAMGSEYAPAVFRCQPVPGGYIFVVDYSLR